METLPVLPRKEIIGGRLGALGVLLTCEVYFHQLIFGQTRPMYFVVILVQLVIAVTLGIAASVLHSRWWLAGALFSVATLGIIVASLSV